MSVKDLAFGLVHVFGKDEERVLAETEDDCLFEWGVVGDSNVEDLAEVFDRGVKLELHGF